MITSCWTGAVASARQDVALYTQNMMEEVTTQRKAVVKVGEETKRKDICVGGDVTLDLLVTGIDDYSVTWYRLGEPVALREGKEPLVLNGVTTAATDGYYCEIVDNTDAASPHFYSDTLSLMVHDYGVSIAAPAKEEYCLGEVILLKASHKAIQVGKDTLYSWSVPAAVGEVVGSLNTDSVKFILKAGGDIQLESSAFGCPATVQTQAVKLHAFEVKIDKSTLPGEVCFGDSLKLTAIGDGATGYEWKGAGISGETDKASVKVKFAENGDFVLKASDGICQSTDAVHFNIQRFTVHVVAPSAERGICFQAPLTLSTRWEGDSKLGELSYQWTGEGIQSATTASNVEVRVGEKAHYVVEAVLGVCKAKDSVTYTVHHLQAGIVPPAQLDICNRDTVKLEASFGMPVIPGDTLFTWTAEQIIEGADQHQMKAVLNNVGTVKLKVQDKYCVDSTSVDFTVQQFNINIQADDPDRTVCSGDQLTLRAVGTLPAILHWVGEGIQGAAENTSVNIKFGDNGIFALKAADQKNKCHDTDTIQYTVEHFSAKISREGELEACEGDRIYLKSLVESSVTEGNVNYRWVGENIQGVSDQSEAEAVIGGNGKYKLYTSLSRCEDADSVEYKVKSFRTAIVPPASGKVCYGDTVVLYASHAAVTVDTIYHWTADGIIGRNDLDSVKVVLTENGKVSLNTQAYGCIATDEYTFTIVHYQLKIQTNQVDKEVCYGSELPLMASNAATVLPGAEWTWSGDGIQSASGTNTIVKFGDNGKFYLTYTDGQCRERDSIEFSVRKYEVDIQVAKGGDLSRCWLDTLTLLASNRDSKPVGAIYTWGGEGISSKDLNADSVKLKLDQNGKFTLRSSDGKCSTEAVINFHIHKYEVGIQQPEQWPDICRRTAVQLSATNTGTALPDGATYSWSGEGLEGASIDATVRFVVGEKAEYALKAYDGTCYTYDTLRYQVQEYNTGIHKPSAMEVCYGDEMTLEATDQTGDTYTWAGQGINGSTTGASTTAVLTENGVFTLHTTKGVCTVEDQIEFVIKKYNLSIPTSQVLPEPQKLTLRAVKEANSKLDWYIGNVHVFGPSSGETAELDIKADAQVKVVMTMNLDKCTSTAFCDVRVGTRDSRKYHGGQADGFAIYRPSIRLRRRDTSACVNTTVWARLQTILYEGYNYEWFQVGRENEGAVCQTPNLYIARCQLEQEGKFYCRVKDAEGDAYIYSDTLQLTVKNGPVAKITLPTEGLERCYGEEMALTAENVAANYTYEWTGADITGGALTDKLALRTVQGGLYTLKVSDGTCSSIDSIRLQVRPALEVDIVNQINLVSNQLISIFARTNIAEGEVTWTWQETTQTGRGPVTIDVQQPGTIYVSLEDGHCQVKDSCRVYIKESTTFYGGVNDGFDESVASLKVAQKELAACTGERVSMDITGLTASNCKYEWFLIGSSDQKVGSERNHIIDVCTILDAGTYYCQATSGDRTWRSDTLTLTIKEGPIAQILQADDALKACFGEKKELSANPVSGQYEWSGEGIIAGRYESTMTLKAGMGGIYVLKVTEGSCATTDTVTLEVVRPKVDIPDLFYLAKQGSIEVETVRSNPDTEVKWYINDGFYTTSKGKVTLPLNLTGRVEIRADIEEQNCPASDTMLVFIKDPITFTTGEHLDDGFAGSRSRLRVEERLLQPCPTEDIVMKLRSDVVGYYQYKWYKVGTPDTEVAKGLSYEILKCTDVFNGEYYCKALKADEAGEFYSDTVKLEVSAGVIAQLGILNDDKNLCYGEDLIFTAQPAGNQYTYHWAGPGVATAVAGDRLEMRAGESGQYTLTVSDGKCTSTDTMTIRVTRLSIEMAATRFLNAPQTAQFTAITPQNQVLWYIGENLKKTGSRVEDLDIAENCRVRAQVEAGGCVDSAVCEVFVKVATLKATPGMDDGFAESKPDLQVEASNILVCQGQEAVIAVKAAGYENYQYKWYKDTDPEPVFIGRVYVIHECKTDQEGLYYCKVKKPDAEEDEEPFWQSPKISLQVKPGPFAVIKPLDTEVCYGSETQLDASLTGTSHSGAEFVYEWSGPGADGMTGAKIDIQPSKDAWYVVKVSDAEIGCADTASVWVKVNRLNIGMIAQLALAKPQLYQFEVYNPNEANLEWFIDDVLQSGNMLDLQKNCTVKVKATKGSCEEYATCVVYVREENLYVTTVENGDDDGFAVTLNQPKVKITPKELELCTANDLKLGLEISGDGFYNYKWYKIGKTDVLGTKREYVVADANANIAGEYYCILENLMVEPTDPNRILLSDTASITYIQGPKAKIGSPLEGADICNGVELTLDASASEQAGTDYTYEWFGAAADGLTGKQIVIVPQGEQYVVKVSDGRCSSTDTVRLHMNSPQITLPEQLHLSAARTIELTPEKQEGTRINWYINNTLRLPNSDIGRLDVASSCKVIAEVVKDVDNGTCSGYDTTWVYVKEPSTFTTGAGYDDGFTYTLPQVKIQQLPGETEFCRGTPLYRSLSGTVTEKLLKYEWRKVGSIKVIYEGKDLYIPKCEMSDTGRYYCVATDIAAIGKDQKLFYSDTVRLNVIPGPVAKISAPTEGQQVCYKAPLDLDASETEIGKYPYTDVYEYFWMGEHVKAPTLYHTQANPENSGRYILKVTNGVCTTYDTVAINVKAPDVQIQRTLFIEANGQQRFIVSNPEKNTVNWYVDNTLKVEKKDTADIMLVGDCRVIVEMEAAGCRKTDTCLVFKKDEGTFLAGGGEQANDDGFYVSGTSFYINKIESTELVCHGATSVFTIDVVGNDFYRYAWKKKGNPAVLSNERTYRIENTDASHAGAYYCEVTDVSNNNTRVSNEVYLEVIDLPKTKILTDRQEICEGTSLTLQADASLLGSGRNYTYLWSGNNLDNNRESTITVNPRYSGRYILTISDANCFTKDTVDITVVKQGLKVPKVCMIKAGEDISIKAEIAAGTKINWRVNGVMYNNINPLVLNGLKESVTYIAEATGVCAEKVTGNVFVRSNAGYAGGEDDGFTMPNGMPQIIDHSAEIVGCGQDTASLFVELLKKDESVEYSWQRYDETSRDFVEFTPGLPEGHVTGLDSARLYFKEITSEDEGRYRCRIKATMGFINGPVTNLVKGTVPRVNGPMNDIQKCEGKDIQFMLTASVPNGKAPQYRWYYSETPDNFRQLLPELDLDHPYYDIAGIEKSNEGYYMTEVYNLCGSVYDTAYLEVWQKPTIVRQSGDTAICLETPVRLWVEAVGGGTYGYSLYQIEKDKNGNYVRDLRLVYRGLDPWYDLVVPSDIDQGDYVWTVWNECDSTRHNQSFHLEVEHSPAVNYSYLDTTICIGTRTIALDAQENITAPGASTRYRWTKNGQPFTQVNAVHLVDPLTHADTGVYKCFAYNACPDQLMKEFRIHKKEAPVIDADITLAKDSYCEGEPIEVQVNYSSDAGEVTQQWYFNSQPVKDGDDRISGMNTDTLRIDSVVAVDNGRYYVILKNSCGERQSNSVNLTVDLPARFAVGGDLAGKHQYLCLEDNAVIAVNATGKETIDYTWTKDGNTISGARTSRLQLNGVTLADVGEYCCYIQNICNRQAEYTCDSLYIITPQVFRLEGAGKYCGYEEGREVTLTGYEPQVTYQLYRYGTDGSAAIVATVKGSEENESGVLSFGKLPAGRYYAMASAVHDTKLCTARMEGEIEIIRDITPAQYDFVVSDPICAGGTSGSLTLKGSENDATIEYTLQRLAEPDSWNNYGRALPGTGGELIWNNLVAGVYRVQAVSTQSGCTIQVGNVDTLIERSYPKRFDLLAQRGDTTNCQGMEPDVVLELNGTEQACQYTLLKNGETTDRVLSGETIVWDKVYGAAGGIVYAVRATTKYGCSLEMGKVTVVEKAAPVEFIVKGGGYYCTGDDGTQEITIDGETQQSVRYDVYEKAGAQLLTDTLFFGTGRPIVFELPNKGGEYYVLATDTLDGCIAKTQNQFFSIQEDSLKIMPMQEQIINSGTSASLLADIRYAVNEPVIEWQPQELFAVGGNTVKDPRTLRLEHGERFIVTAYDGHCKVEGEALVRLEGANLYTQIKLQNCLTDADTLRLCEGEKVNLCSWTDGGKSPYTYKWLDKNVSPELPVGIGSQLMGYGKEASGYVYLEVTTSVGQYAKDSIWVEYESLPKQNLVIEKRGLNCALMGEPVQFVLKGSESEVVYSLEYSADTRRYETAGQTWPGDGNDLIFSVNFAEETAGYYRLLAEKTYKGGNVCSTMLNVGELRQRPQLYTAKVLTPTEYCIDTQRDSIRLEETEAGVTYRLVNTTSQQMVEAITSQGDPISYAGYFGSGRFRVVAQLGVCVDSMENVIQINALPRPLIGEVDGLGVYCMNGTDPLKELMVKKTIRAVGYTLYRDSVDRREQIGEVRYGTGNEGEPLSLGKPEKAGLYLIVSQYQEGLQCTDTVRGLSLVNPPKTVKLVEESGTYCYAEGGLDTVVKIYDVDPLVDYQLKDLSGNVVGSFGERNVDTLYCRATLKGGKYYVWSTATQCSDILGIYTVEERKQLADLKLIQPLSECEGFGLTMGVQASEKGVTYELYEMVGSGFGHKITEAVGDGNDLIIGTYSVAGTYLIRAVDPAGCDLQLSETYTISPLPDQYNTTASAIEYCAGDAGVVLGLSGTQANVNYWLQRWDENTGTYVRVSASAIIFGTGATDAEGQPAGQVFSGKYKAGKYRVVTEGCHQQVMDEGVEISEIAQPLDIPVSIRGKACQDSVVTVVLEGTEPGVRYALLHNGTWAGLDTLTGMGRDTSWTFTKAQSGIYSVQAIRKYCSYPLTALVKVGVPTKLVDLEGLDPLCANKTGTLRLNGAALGSKYQLWGKNQDTLFNGVVSGKDVVFSGVLPGETYIVIARNEMCETQSGEYLFGAKDLPVVNEDNFVIEDCSGSGKGDILLHGLNNTYLYTLVGPGCDVRLMNTNKDSLLKDMSAGEYCLTVRNLETGCELQPICQNVRRALPLDSIVKPLNYCAGENGVKLQLSGSTYNVRYSMLQLDETPVETINYPLKTFVNEYVEGRYLLKKENLGLNGGCVSLDTVVVSEVPIPVVDFTVTAGTGGALCEKGNNQLTLETTEAGVDYVLRLNKNTEVDTLTGDGGPLTFEGWKKAGSYEIIARSAGRCQVVFPGSWKVNPVPAQINATDGQYCYDAASSNPRGASVFVKNMDPSAKYYFCNEFQLDSISGLNSGSFKLAPAGEYVVTGVYENTGCMDTVARVGIWEIPLPDVFTISNISGDLCDVKARIRLSGSEAEGVLYSLYMNDYFLVSGPGIGTGGPINFEEVDAPGTYRVYAEREDTECGVWMDGKVVIASAHPAPLLEVRGVYCMGETAGNAKIALLNPVKGWTYFIGRDLDESKRIKITNQTIVEWDSVGMGGLLAGEYMLNGINECGDMKELGKATVKAMPSATPYKLITGDTIVCEGNKHELLLSNSDKGVSYQLKQKIGNEVIAVLPEPVKGTGWPLSLGEYEKTSLFFIEATVDSSQCSRLIDTMQLTSVTNPPSPLIVNRDSCVEPGTPIVIEIAGRRQPYVDYYLVVNGVIVDTITRFAPPNVKTFKPQYDLGFYDVIASNEVGCQTYAHGAGFVEAPNLDFNIGGAADTTICSAGKVDIWLDTTQVGCKYVLMKNGMMTRDTLRGTGKGMLVKTVTEAGLYQIMVVVSKEVQEVMKDSKNVRVLHSPVLEVDSELGYCAGGDGVEIVVKNTQVDFDYTLYLPDGGWDFFVGDGGNMKFKSGSEATVFKKGTYRVEVTNPEVSTCPTTKELVIKEVNLPAQAALSLMGGSPYICEYPEYRTLVLAESQLDVEYALYRRSQPGTLVAQIQEGNGKSLTFQVQDTGVYYVAARSRIGEGCQSEMANDVEILVPEPMQIFDLSSIKSSYCDTAKVILGSVKLSGSEPKVNYELYRDGQPTGLVTAGNRSILKWSGLKGKPAALATGGDNDGYIYTVKAVNQETGCAKPMTGRVSMIEETKVLISRQDRDLDVCMGTPQTLHIYASGGMLNYQWKKGGKLISTESYYSIDSITQEDIGTYQCVVSNQCGYDMSANIDVNVRAVVIQDKKMKDLLICEDPSDVRIPSTAVAEEYKWYRLGNDEVISRKQTLELLGATKETAEGSYVCYASTTCGGIFDTCRLEFNRQPEVIWKGGVEKALCVGSQYQMEVESRDVVKWYRNGLDMNVEGNVFTIDSLETDLAGLYTVVVSNQCSERGPIQIQTLYADEPIQVVSVTDSLKHYCKNSMISLEIVTQPSERVTYRWYQNGAFYKDNVGNKLQFTAQQGENGTKYLVRYSNACTPLGPPWTERGMTIRIDDMVKFNALNPETQICAQDGEITDLKLKDKGLEGETYRWMYSPDGVITYKALERDTAILPVENKRSEAGYYYCEVTNACGMKATDITHVIVDSLPAISGDLRDTTVCQNSNMVFKLKAKGGGLTYAWKKLKKNSATIETPNIFKPSGFESESQLELTQLGVADDSCLIWCEVTNYCQTIYSDTTVVRVVPNARVVFAQENVMMCEGAEAEAVVKLEHGALPATYGYQVDGGEIIYRDFLEHFEDTIPVTGAGTYQLVSLTLNKLTCVDKKPTAVLEAGYYERYTATLAGNFEGCVGAEAEFTVSVDKGEGPWEVVLIRESDGKVADEIAEFPLTLNEKVSTLRFKPVKNEHYRIKEIVERGGSGCTGLMAGVAAAQVHQPDRVSFSSLTTDVFGGCASVDFNNILRPTVSGGTYYINQQLAQNTTLPTEPGNYHIVYMTRTAYGCQDSAKVDLTRDTLPRLTLTCNDDLCPGESTDLKIHVDGTGPFTVVTNMKEIGLDGRETFYNNLKKKTDANGNCSYNIFNNSDLKSRTYEIISVTDKYGCGLEASLPTAKKVITMHERPLLQVETRHALYNGGQWTSEIKDFVVPDKGTVMFRVTQLRGGNPWNMIMERTLNGEVKTYPYSNLKNTVVDNILATEGVYRFTASDNYCTIAEELIEERKVSYTEAGYLKLKVMLEGAYSEESGQMETQIEDLLPLRGLPGLPEAGTGRKWIDWVVVELRKTIDAEAVIRDTLLLRSDGYVADRTGNELLTVFGENFSLLEQNAYYIVVKHRNHLAIASSKSRIYTEPDMANLVDLTDSRYVYSMDGDLARHMKELGKTGVKTIWGMAVGNILGNSLITIANPNEIQLKGGGVTNRIYHLYDVNFDGQVKWAKEGIVDANKVEVDAADDAYRVYKNRDMFSEVPEN